jgi:agmatinase
VNVLVFPFDCFGNAGTARGAELLGDIIREILDDADFEKRPCRQHQLIRTVRILEERFDNPETLSQWRETGCELLAEPLKHRERTLWLAGNHLAALPIYDSLGPKDLIVQLDAHFDCYHLHDTHEDLSHGNFLRHAKGKAKLVNIGQRDLFLLKKEIDQYYDAVLSPDDAAGLQKFVAKADRVWLDIDIDVLDPTFCPAVLDAVPFGLNPQQLLKIAESCWSEKLVGISISEFCPARDDRDRSLELLGWFVEWLLLRDAG